MEPRLRSVPWWMLWANPIFRRYCRSRLRPLPLTLSCILTLIFTLFFVLLAYFGVYSTTRDHQLASRAVILPLLFCQAVILFLKGTFSAAGGIVREQTEGITEYQRLTPMSPLGKIVGYLFGLPIREYVLLGLTMPLMFYAVVVGQIPWMAIVKVYLVFFSSALLYHLTGMVSGTTIKHKVFAGFLSQVLILVIYWVLPQLSKVGYVIFEYLTLFPVLGEQGMTVMSDTPITDRDMRGMVEYFSDKVPTVQFYDLNLSQLQSTLLVQGFLGLIFVVILKRKWVSAENHLLGKHFSLLILGGVVTLVLGNALPLIEKGQILLSSNTQWGRVYQPVVKQMAKEEGMLICGLFGLVLMLVAAILIFVITPTKDEYRSGLRRARKLNVSRINLGADEASGLIHSAIFTVLVVIAWVIFSRALFQGPNYSNVEIPWRFWLAYPLAIIPVCLCFQAFLERQGRGITSVMLVVMWIVPLMIALVLFVASSFEVIEPNIYLVGVSGLCLPIFAAFTSIAEVGVPESFDFKHIHYAFWIGVVFYVALSLFLLMRLFEYHARMKTETDAEGS